MRKFIIVDTQNAFMRARHVGHQAADNWTKIGLSLHITLGGIKKMWEKFNPDHVVFCAEGRSWRKDVDPYYKANRAKARSEETPKEKEEMEEFFAMVNDFLEFIETKTNCTLLRDPMLEADDMIAGFIRRHPDDMHIIISTDGDFVQLIAPNVQQYNPVQEFLYTMAGVFDDKGRLAKNKKGELLDAPDPELSLFLKTVKGDTSDNVFSAYPGARMKSTKKAVGIMEAYEDREKKGFAWNSFMNHKYEHHERGEVKVKDMFAHNNLLVNLNAQPDFIVERMNDAIDVALAREPAKMIGIHFMRFAHKYELTTIENNAEAYVSFLSAKYMR